MFPLIGWGRLFAILTRANVSPRRGRRLGRSERRITFMAFQRRTHTCGELRDTHLGKTVILNGWVNTYRAYNDQIFIDLRDRYGVTQVVFEVDHPIVFAAAQEMRNEWVLGIKGKVRERLPGKHNPKLATGDVEVVVDEVAILNRCPTPPFEVMSIP